VDNDLAWERVQIFEQAFEKVVARRVTLDASYYFRSEAASEFLRRRYSRLDLPVPSTSSAVGPVRIRAVTSRPPSADAASAS
jgi:hypothetical protein